MSDQTQCGHHCFDQAHCPKPTISIKLYKLQKNNNKMQCYGGSFDVGYCIPQSVVFYKLSQYSCNFLNKTVML